MELRKTIMGLLGNKEKAPENKFKAEDQFELKTDWLGMKAGTTGEILYVDNANKILATDIQGKNWSIPFDIANNVISTSHEIFARESKR